VPHITAIYAIIGVIAVLRADCNTRLGWDTNLKSAVTLQPVKEEPPLNVRCKDKFLIQTTSLGGPREFLSPNDLVRGRLGVSVKHVSTNDGFHFVSQWNPVDADDHESVVYQQKIRVNYLPPEGESIPEDLLEQPSMLTSEGDISVRASWISP
jgi:hypothetical protein